MTESFYNRLFVSYQALYSRGGCASWAFFPHWVLRQLCALITLQYSRTALFRGTWEQSLWIEKKITSKFCKVYFGNKGWSLIKNTHPDKQKTTFLIFFSVNEVMQPVCPAHLLPFISMLFFLKGDTKWYYVVIYFHLPLCLSSTVIILTSVLKTGFWLK